MKLMKKLTALILVVALVMALAITASAANITINGAIDGANYYGYRLLETTTSLNCTKAEHKEITDHLSTCYNISYSVNSKYRDILQTHSGKTSDSDIISYIGGLDDAALRTFADNVYGTISKTQNMGADKTGVGSGSSAVLENADQGYWLIVETISDDAYDGAYSLVMLDTSGSRDIAVNTKREEPTLDKQVFDNQSYRKAADHQIGDDIDFLLITDVPVPSGYSKYSYIIHDTMEQGLTFQADSVKILLNSTTGTALSKDYYTVDAAPTATGKCATEACDFHITVNMIKAFADGVLKGDDRLYVMYQAQLNEKCDVIENGRNISNANANTAWLEYSNHPYNEDLTATCQEAVAYVWTMRMELKKVDSAQSVLGGAKFVLSLNKDLTEEDLRDDDGDGTLDKGYDKMVPLIKTTTDNGTTVYRLAPESYTGETVYEIEVGTAELQGFNDQIDYYLYEIEAPEGYNQLKNAVSVKFFVQYDAANPILMSNGYPKISVNGTPETGELVASVVNQAGAELPFTGGIGTTIFYVLGGLMVVGAAVLLITKKRMGAEA